MISVMVLFLYFNPRACVRHDYRPTSRRRDPRHFNPRAYVRHDGVGFGNRPLDRISIHVPT